MANYHPIFSDQRAAINWARRVLRRAGAHVILDTETTGLKETDEIVQVAVIDLEGNVRFNENIRPTKRKRMSRDAVAVHGLTMDMLSDCRTFSEFRRPLEAAIGTRRIITYNAAFDMRLYRQSYDLAGGFLPKGEWDCAMLEYAKFVGEWNDYHHDYRWQQLPSGTHGALGDCLATLKLIQTMASAVKLRRWYEFWVGR